MSKPVFISICIPAYKRADYLKRLLQSVVQQSYTDFEVIITDDSPDSSVRELFEQYQETFTIRYFKNATALGSPENWNAGIKQAKGQWIKMMHDDDWFADANSLQSFADAALQQKEASFIFSGYTEIDVEKGTRHPFVISNFYLGLLKKTPLTLFKQNFIGHPSTTLIKNEGQNLYDKNLKWVVDIEYYIRYLNLHPQLMAIQQPLINIGINEYQITKEVFRNPAIEIPEVLYLSHKLPPNSFKNIFVFDYYWRFVRNLAIRNEDDIIKYAPGVVVLPVIKQMIKAQAQWPLRILKKGVVSKTLMLASYIKHYKRL